MLVWFHSSSSSNSSSDFEFSCGGGGKQTEYENRFAEDEDEDELNIPGLLTGYARRGTDSGCAAKGLSIPIRERPRCRDWRRRPNQPHASPDPHASAQPPRQHGRRTRPCLQRIHPGATPGHCATVPVTHPYCPHGTFRKVPGEAGRPHEIKLSPPSGGRYPFGWPA